MQPAPNPPSGCSGHGNVGWGRIDGAGGLRQKPLQRARHACPALKRQQHSGMTAVGDTPSWSLTRKTRASLLGAPPEPARLPHAVTPTHSWPKAPASPLSTRSRLPHCGPLLGWPFRGHTAQLHSHEARDSRRHRGRKSPSQTDSKPFALHHSTFNLRHEVPPSSSGRDAGARPAQTLGNRGTCRQWPSLHRAPRHP